jgi:predicted O-methyltransferase YrrM
MRGGLKDGNASAAILSARPMQTNLNTLGNYVSWSPLYRPISQEQISFDYIRDLISIDASVIIEIGAHHGWHTTRFLNHFPHARIYSFEPDPRAIAKFKARIRDPHSRLYEMAIGATDGEAKFHVSSGLTHGRTKTVLPKLI